MNVYIPLSIVLLVLLLIFGTYGWRRGWVAEVVTLAGVLFSWLVITYASDAIVRLVNQMALALRLFLAGGLDSPSLSATLADLRQKPMLVPSNQGLFLAILFGGLVLLAYAIPNLFMVRRAFTRWDNILGLLVGFLNGVLVAFFFIQLTKFNFVATFGLTTGSNATDVQVAVNTGGLFDDLQRIFVPILLGVIALVVGSIFLRGFRSSRSSGGASGSRPTGH